MKPLLVSTAFPSLRNDTTIAIAQIEATATMPATDGLPADLVLDMTMTYVRFLVDDQRNTAAMQAIEYLVYADDAATLPPLYAAWLWLARMSLIINNKQHASALSSAENALTQLAGIPGKKNEDFLAILAAILYNLADIHHNTAENSRAAKELTKAQQLYQRLNHRNPERFAAMLIYAVEASTDIIKSRNAQLNVLEHYQHETLLYRQQLEQTADQEQARQALTALVDSLYNEGNIMLQMGNTRNAVKYFSKAIRYQKKLNLPLSEKDLSLSIGLAKALMRLVNRRAAAEQLLNSLLPLARRLEAHNHIIEIENLLLGKNRNNNIMNLLKGIF